MSELRLSASATADFDEAADWYSTNDPEITERFIDAVNRTLGRIEVSPLSFPIVAGTHVRQATVNRFSYIVLFSVRHDHVWIYSIFHTSRNPLIWRGRID